MLPALIIFLLTYLLMLALPQYRPFAALGGAALFLALGAAGLWDFTLMDAARAVDFNVLLMMAGTMGTVSLFIESRMPARPIPYSHPRTLGTGKKPLFPHLLSKKNTF